MSPAEITEWGKTFHAVGSPRSRAAPRVLREHREVPHSTANVPDRGILKPM